MTSGPVISLLHIGSSIFGLVGLVLSMIGVRRFVVNPKETGESLQRGKRGLMFALCIVAIPVTMVCEIVLLAVVLGTWRSAVLTTNQRSPTRPLRCSIDICG